MQLYNSEFMALALADAPIDPRTGNKVIYNASWTATTPSMIGERNEDWVRRELDWFALGSDKLSDMEPPVPQAFQACAGHDDRVNSAYGHILFSDEEHSPSLYQRALNAFFEEGTMTRHSVAIITDRDVHNLATHNGRHDFICTNALNFMIDSDNRLHIVAQMRSMDAVWGYRADYSMWDYVMDKMVSDINAVMYTTWGEVTRGDITFQVANLHVYPRHFDLLEWWAHKIYDDQERIARRSWMDRVTREHIESHKDTTNNNKEI